MSGNFGRMDERPNRWMEYEYQKKKLKKMPPDEYEKAIKEIAEKLGL
jgi:hypothetical protein